MRREGRQHGMVRTSEISFLTPNKRIVNKIESLPVAGRFAKTSNKPTNHSKFTSIDKERQTRPVNKSKGKAKHTYKLKSNGLKMDCNTVDWNSDRSYRVGCTGLSAAVFLDYLFGGDDYYDQVEVHEGDYHESTIEDQGDHDHGLEAGLQNFTDVIAVNDAEEVCVDHGEDEIDVRSSNIDGDDDKDDDDTVFYSIWVDEYCDSDHEGDEAWCLVKEDL